MKTFRKHIEWIVFLCGLLLLANMDTSSTGIDLCLFDWIGFNYCLGEGLGHSIAYFFQGDLKSSIAANFMGPFAVGVMSFRIISIWIKLITEKKNQQLGTNYV